MMMLITSTTRGKSLSSRLPIIERRSQLLMKCSTFSTSIYSSFLGRRGVPRQVHHRRFTTPSSSSSSSSATPLSITIVSRDTASLEDAYSTLVEGLGFEDVWAPRLNSTISSSSSSSSSSSLFAGAVSCGVRLGNGPILELIAFPRIPWRWHQGTRKGGAEASPRLRILSLNVPSTTNNTTAAHLPFITASESSSSSCFLPCEADVFSALDRQRGRTKVSSFMASLSNIGVRSSSITNMLGLPHVGPFLVSNSAHNATNSSSSRSSRSPSLAPSSDETMKKRTSSSLSSTAPVLLETVLALPTPDLFSLCTERIQQAGGIRNPSFPSLWQLPGIAASNNLSTSTYAVESSFVRLVPGKYSALVIGPSLHTNIQNTRKNIVDRLQQYADRRKSGTHTKKNNDDDVAAAAGARHLPNTPPPPTTHQHTVASIYGERKSHGENSQNESQMILVPAFVPSLSGLDIRIASETSMQRGNESEKDGSSSSNRKPMTMVMRGANGSSSNRSTTITYQPSAVFNESPATMDDDVDQELNPGANHPSKQVPMNCGSVTGMQVKATMKTRLWSL